MVLAKLRERDIVSYIRLQAGEKKKVRFVLAWNAPVQYNYWDPVKDENGKWQTVPTYEFDDKLPYGHGEKSVYIISGFMRLSREEAFAIRYHMGYSGTEDARNVSKAFEAFPLSFALSTADMEATFLMEQ